MIELIDISTLSLLEKNPRKITKSQFEKLLKSIKEDPGFLECRPCLVNRVGDELTVYAGNQRLRAAMKLGWDKIPCVIEDNLSESRMKSRVIKDNKQYGIFDYDELFSTFDDDLLIDAGFSLEELTGYKSVDEIIEDQTEELPKGKKKKECPNCGHEF